jgi:hypothetical protein
VIYDEWRRMFGIVYGTEQLERPGKSPEAQALRSAYQIQIKIGVKFPVLLFAVHTYYALLMKMLATELIVAQGSLGDSFVGASRAPISASSWLSSSQGRFSTATTLGTRSSRTSSAGIPMRGTRISRMSSGGWCRPSEPTTLPPFR